MVARDDDEDDGVCVFMQMLCNVPKYLRGGSTTGQGFCNCIPSRQMLGDPQMPCEVFLYFLKSFYAFPLNVCGMP